MILPSFPNVSSWSCPACLSCFWPVSQNSQSGKQLYCNQGLHVLLQVGKHGIIIEFNDPDYNARRSATYLPEVAAHEGMLAVLFVDGY